MSESKLLNNILSEGIFTLFLGLFVLLAPKTTPISFGFTLCIAYLTYGGFKTIMGFQGKNYSKFFIIDIFTGIVLTLVGMLLFFAPIIDIMPTIAIIGVYLVLQSISSSATAIRARNTLDLWNIIYLTALVELFFGIIVIIILSPSALWVAGILTGLDFLIRGLVYINLRLFEEYKRGVNGI